MNRSPSTEQGVLSQFSGFSEEIEHFTRDPCTTQPKSCTQSTKYALKEQEVNTCTNCEHSHRHMYDHLTQNTGRMQRQHLQNFSHAEFSPGMENTPAFLGKQFLQGKEKITCSNMENMPALLWNQSIQGNVDTCTFTSGSTAPSRHSMLSIPTHPRKVQQNFEQLEKESSNTVALPGFNRNADATTHVETSRNAQNNVSIHVNMDTNHTAHRYRHTKKEVHFLSRPSELQPTENPETQKFDSAHVQLPRHEYS